MRRLGFTLVEVNLAMFIMAVGTLGLVSLYSLGYRENQQSNEDVQAAAVAEMNLNALTAALSSTNMTWSAWESLGLQPASGWGTYAGDTSGIDSRDDGEDSSGSETRALANPSGTARTVFGKVMSAGGSSASFEDEGLACGIVINQQGPKCSVAVRCGRRAATLVYQPLYYTEVYFQGLPQEGGAQ